tara:strand:- start:1516 stop:1668 length:153 start_codon:yes stop_codon:yes gene_type:complete
MYGLWNTIDGQPTFAGDYGITLEELMLIRKLERPCTASLHSRGDIASRFQ